MNSYKSIIISENLIENGEVTTEDLELINDNLEDFNNRLKTNYTVEVKNYDYPYILSMDCPELDSRINRFLSKKYEKISEGRLLNIEINILKQKTYNLKARITLNYEKNLELMSDIKKYFDFYNNYCPINILSKESSEEFKSICKYHLNSIDKILNNL